MFDRFLSWFGLARKRDLVRVEKELKRVTEFADLHLDSSRNLTATVNQLYSRLAEAVWERDYTAVYNGKLNDLRGRVDEELERSRS